MWPRLIDLEPNVPVRFTAGEQCGEVVLRGLTHHTQPDRWIDEPVVDEVIVGATVDLMLDDEPITLVHRPYQMPSVHGRWRLAVELTRPWNVGIRTVPDFAAAVRLAILPVDQPWGPSDLVFPLADYRWRADTYQNTWAGLVPYNKHYYHRGEDFGGIPGAHAVLAVCSGRVIESPVPNGDGRSNGLVIAGDNGLVYRYGHMDIETIDPSLTVGAAVEAGQPVGRNGMTWNGRKTQVNDPHLHVGFQRPVARGAKPASGEAMEGALTDICAYPMLVAAYRRTYDDPLLPNAGGYHFALPGQPVTLDGSRSQPGRRAIRGMRWQLSDGRRVKGATAEVSHDRPGLYSEMLEVIADDGSVDRDFAQVRVYDPQRGSDMATGWLHYQPHRNIRAGDPVVFRNALANVTEPCVDFGDGTPAQPIDAECTHAFANMGLYTVTLTGRGPANEPVTVRTRVQVDA